MELQIPIPVSSRFWGKIMKESQSVSLLTRASPNLHVHNKIAQVLAKGPREPLSCCARGMVNFWGKEAGQELRGTAGRRRDLWKAGAPSEGGDACRYDPSDQSQLQGWVVSYCNPWLLEQG